MIQPDLFPQLERRLSDAEAEAGFAELLRTVSEMEFTSDEMRGIKPVRRLSEFCAEHVMIARGENAIELDNTEIKVGKMGGQACAHGC